MREDWFLPRQPREATEAPREQAAKLNPPSRGVGAHVKGRIDHTLAGDVQRLVDLRV